MKGIRPKKISDIVSYTPQSFEKSTLEVCEILKPSENEILFLNEEEKKFHIER